MTVFTKQAIFRQANDCFSVVSFPDRHFVYWGSENETSISVTICLVWGYMWEGYRGHVIPCTTATHMRELVCVYCKERQSTWDKYEDSLLPTRHVNLSLCSSFVTGSWHSFYHNHTHKMVKPSTIGWCGGGELRTTHVSDETIGHQFHGILDSALLLYICQLHSQFFLGGLGMSIRLTRWVPSTKK